MRAHVLAVLLIFPATAVQAADPRPLAVVKARLHEVKAENSERLRTLEQMFHDAGCSGSRLTAQAVPKADLPNLICTLKGKGDRIVIVSAHFDMTGPGLGVADNWGSASLLPSVYESLRVVEPEHTFVFIGFTDEEKGLVGSKHYASKLSDAERSRITAMVNMDGVGMSWTRVWATQADRSLLQLLKRVAREERLPVGEINLDGAGIMDSFPFAERGIPSISLHGLADGNWGIPHSRDDQLDAVDLNHLYATYRLLLRYLVAIDASGKAPDRTKTPARAPALH